MAASTLSSSQSRRGNAHSDVLHGSPGLLCRNGDYMATNRDSLAPPKFQIGETSILWNSIEGWPLNDLTVF